MGMIEKRDLLTDQRDGRFKEASGHGDTAVFGDAAAGLLTEVIGKIFGGSAHTLAVGGVAFKRCLSGASMLAVVIDIAQPAIESQVKIVQSFSAHAREEIAAYGAEEPFDLTFTLGLIGFGVDQCDAQRSGDLVEMKRTKRRAVIDIELAR